MTARRTWTVALAALLVVAACSNEGTDETTTTFPGTATTTTQPPAATTATTATPTTTLAAEPLMEIVVTLDVPWQPEPDLDEAQIAAQRAAIADIQQQLIDLLDGTRFEVVQRFELTPQLALAVDDEALERINASDLVAGATEDTPDPAG